MQLRGGWPACGHSVHRAPGAGRAPRARTDKRTQRRRTFDSYQLKLLEAGEAGVAYAYSVVVTNLTDDVVELEAWFRRRALVEERICDSKAGVACATCPRATRRST
ncbi:MAG: hypothetical protein M0Z69_00795 [Actinomycetota bacterium]|nr:hypothetical protein [Actinomycetota bacterium]